VAIELLLQLPRRLRLQFILQPSFGFSELLRLLQRLALGLGLQARPLLAGLSAFLFALLLAGVAFAADRLQIGFEVIGAVVVVDFLAWLDVLDGADEHLALARLDV
jgi:hypothetical protein